MLQRSEVPSVEKKRSILIATFSERLNQIESTRVELLVPHSFVILIAPHYDLQSLRIPSVCFDATCLAFQPHAESFATADEMLAYILDESPGLAFISSSFCDYTRMFSQYSELLAHSLHPLAGSARAKFCAIMFLSIILIKASKGSRRLYRQSTEAKPHQAKFLSMFFFAVGIKEEIIEMVISSYLFRNE